jgi:type III restriction enzyme
LDFFEFANLKAYLPELVSIREFIFSPSYLKNAKLEVAGSAERVEKLDLEDKLYVAVRMLEGIAGIITSSKREFVGTKEFKPRAIKEVITDKQLNFSIDEGDDNELGRSMNDPKETAIHLDLTTCSWYAFQDCYGTSEEKLLIKFVDVHLPSLRSRYSDVYLIRNERHFKLYNFSDGKPLEPDFLLYLIGKVSSDTMHYQVFIEPKGKHLLKHDEWKERFLKVLRDDARIEQLWKGQQYVVWGLPFFNSNLRMVEFERAFDELL